MPSKYNPKEKVRDTLKRKKAEIKKVPLPKGSPSWDDVMDKTLGEIVKGVRKRTTGYGIIMKVLIDSRFDK